MKNKDGNQWLYLKEDGRKSIKNKYGNQWL